MARIGQGIVGGFSGSVGPVVGYQWRGRWYMRSRPQEVSNPRTEAQQEHRMMFREEVRLASRLNWILRESMGDLSLDEGLTPCNYFIKENQKNFGWMAGTEGAEGRLTVDWANLVLSHGPVAPVGFGVPEVSEGTRLTIGFEKNPLHVRAGAFDKVYLYLYCTDLEEGFLVAPVYRHEQRVSVVLPAKWAGREVQLYGLVEDQQGRWSETLYIGCGPLEEGTEEAEEAVDPVQAVDSSQAGHSNLASPASQASLACQATPCSPPGAAD